MRGLLAIPTVWAVLSWLFGCTVAALPLLAEATHLFNDPSSTAFRTAYDHHYKDLAIYVMVITGVGLGDAFEAGRLNRRPESPGAFFAWITFCMLLVLSFLLAISFGQTLVDSAPKFRLPDTLFLWSLVISLISKVSAELCR